MKLFEKECRQIFKSFLYWAFVMVIVVLYFSQFGNIAGNDIRKAEQAGAEYSANDPLMEPPKSNANYGVKQGENPSLVMERAAISLAREYTFNQYGTWPYNRFSKTVNLSNMQQKRVGEILTQITGLSPEQAFLLVPDVELRTDENGMMEQAQNMPINVSYTTFQGLMQELDKMLGGYSAYNAEHQQINYLVPVTYAEKLADYEQLIKQDKITGAYARLFCDYMGLAASLFSVFLSVSFLMRDRRAHMHELIYSRKISSARLIITRYLACIVMEMLPIVVLSAIPSTQLLLFAGRHGLEADSLAFLKYIFCWILPTLLTTTGVGFALTILTDTPLAIAVQFLWSFISMSSGSLTKINGGYYSLGEIAIRHNVLGNYDVMQSNIQALCDNRIFYSCLGIVLLLVSMLLYGLKRRGNLDVRGKLDTIFGVSEDADEAVPDI